MCFSASSASLAYQRTIMKTNRTTKHWRHLLLLLTPLSLLVFPHRTTAETLHGTTLLNWPYVNRLANGQFEGFCIDLLNELAPLMGMAYTLSPVADGQYGGWLPANGTVNGMVGEVMRGDADFAIGDLTVLTTRARFVDFTTSFLEFGLAALVRKDALQGSNIRNFKDLSEQTAIAYGVKRFGANLPLFHDSPTVAKMYSFMDTHPSVFVADEKEGVEKVKRDRYAFIAESTFVEYIVQRDCSLAAIDDRRKHFQFEYAIAVKAGSPLKARFSKALWKLKKSGRIQELKEKYWRSDKCIAGGAGDSVLAKPKPANRPTTSSTVDRSNKDRDVSSSTAGSDGSTSPNNRPNQPSNRGDRLQKGDNIRFAHDSVDVAWK